VVVTAAVIVTAAHADADPQLTFRIGVEPLSLRPSSDTPYFGGYVNDAVTAYNEGVSLYNRAHGMSVAPIDQSALGLDTTLTTFAPGIEFGGSILRFRGEGLVGISSQVHAIGLGIYPIDVRIPLGVVTPYVSVGGTARWMSRSDMDGDVGGLVTARVAAGARWSHIVVELGYSLYEFGGVYNGDELHAMTMYDPRGNAPPPPADRAVAGGTQTGMVDFSLGFTL
jgi:hypothetical protein